MLFLYENKNSSPHLLPQQKFFLNHLIKIYNHMKNHYQVKEKVLFVICQEFNFLE